nr:CoA transferase [Rhodococcus sp. 14-2470-1a]
MALTGEALGPPLLPPGNAASIARELSGLIESATARAPHPVSVDGAALLGERAACTSRTRNGNISVGGSSRLLPTRDSWAVVTKARPDDVLLIGALVGESLTPESVWPHLAAWLASTSDDEVASRIALLGIAGGVVEDRPLVERSPVCTPTRFRSVENALVVDFSALWAGPLCAHLLGLAGARIVKVETPQRPDGARQGNSEFYRLLHGGHESVVLDPSLPRERTALAQLVAHADIVIEASRPRALLGFGLDAERFVDAGGLWISITADGRASDRIGFGDDIAAANGLIARDNYGRPLFVGDAIADPLTGLVAAAAAFTAPTTQGHLIDISMSDVVRSTLVRSEGPADILDVRVPHRRAPTGRVAASGSHTATVLSDLNIESV